MMLMTYYSEKINQRAYMGVLTQIWVLPCVIALLLLPLSTENPWSTYAVLVVLLSPPSPHPLQVGWCSRISGSVRTRTVSAALYNMFVQLQMIVSANIYRDDDKPDYRKFRPRWAIPGEECLGDNSFADTGFSLAGRGNAVLVAIGAYNIVLYLAVKQYYVWRNKSKDKEWKKLSGAEQLTYLETTKADGNKRLDFRFVH
jgi:hypothetical protein